MIDVAWTLYPSSKFASDIIEGNVRMKKIRDGQDVLGGKK